MSHGQQLGLVDVAGEVYVRVDHDPLPADLF